MTEPLFDTVLSSAFTQAERQFLYANEEFKAAMSQTPKEKVEKLLQLGVRLLLTRGYVPPPSSQSTEARAL